MYTPWGFLTERKRWKRLSPCCLVKQSNLFKVVHKNKNLDLKAKQNLTLYLKKKGVAFYAVTKFNKRVELDNIR